MMGGLHPRGSLYERPVNIESAKAHHANFRQVLREHGVRVLTVREILAHGVDQHMGARVQLEGLAMAALGYRLADGADLGTIAEADRYYLTDEYKRQVRGRLAVCGRGVRREGATARCVGAVAVCGGGRCVCVCVWWEEGRGVMRWHARVRGRGKGLRGADRAC